MGQRGGGEGEGTLGWMIDSGIRRGSVQSILIKEELRIGLVHTARAHGVTTLKQTHKHFV